MDKEREIFAFAEEDDTTLPDSNEAETAFGNLLPAPRHRGPVTGPDGTVCIGKVGAAQGMEATSDAFYFWSPEEALVEVTQIITAKSEAYDGQGQPQTMTYYAIVDEVRRTSRRRAIGHEFDESDGDLSHQATFGTDGLTYAKASILRIEPPYLTPPRERGPVFVAREGEAQKAYGAAEMKRGLPIGVIRNGGGVGDAGPGSIDLDYLLGENGGHLNVNGTAGLGTKSSLLMTFVYLLLAAAKREAAALPSEKERLRVVPIVFNVKNYDLFHLDRPNKEYVRNAEENDLLWNRLGIENPGPFTEVTYYAAQQRQGDLAVGDTGRGADVKAFSWSLEDVIKGGLLSYLFSDDDADNDNFAALLLDLENLMVSEHIQPSGEVKRDFKADAPAKNFKQLQEWLMSEDGQDALKARSHNRLTVQKLSRRLLRILHESRGILRLEERNGKPLDVRRADTCGPLVVDLNALSGIPAMQKFVIAAVLQQLIQARTGANAVRGLKYLVVLDELNRFAPRGQRDPITRLIETIAAEMRSQGVLLFGAQQQASYVSAKVIENAATKAIGQTGAQELSSSAWGGLSNAVKSKVMNLSRDEKLILQSGFRQPMHLRIPFPAWAMNPSEVGTATRLAADASATNNDIDDLIGN